MTGPEPGLGFRIKLDNFDGPFDLLLQLIGRHKLDITELALSRVTDEFIGYVRAGGEVWDLEQTSSFLVVAATLLDLKAARLLPSGDVDDPEDLAVLEARDLLFARLLQYRAYKQISAWFADRIAAEQLLRARPAGWRTSSAACCRRSRSPVARPGSPGWPSGHSPGPRNRRCRSNSCIPRSASPSRPTSWSTGCGVRVP